MVTLPTRGQHPDRLQYFHLPAQNGTAPATPLRVPHPPSHEAVSVFSHGEGETLWCPDLGVCFPFSQSACRCAGSGRHSSTGQGPRAPRWLYPPSGRLLLVSSSVGSQGRASAPGGHHSHRSLPRAGSLSAPAGIPEDAGCRVSLQRGVCAGLSARKLVDVLLLMLCFESPCVLSTVPCRLVCAVSSPSPGQPSTFHPWALWGTPCIYCSPVYVL